MKFEEMERLFADDNYYYYYYKVTLWTAAPRLAVKKYLKNRQNYQDLKNSLTPQSI